MIVQSIDLLNYRNIDELHTEFSSGFNVIYGENAQGKSNLLEAIYALAFLKSFRDEKIANLIKFGGQRAVLSASVVEGNRQLRLGLEFFQKTRKAYVNGALVSKFNDYLGLLRAILFVPSDVAMLQNPPLVRRTMLDRMVFTLRPSYLIPMMQYQKVIKQKSAVLRLEVPDTTLLDAYDDQLRGLGTELIAARLDYLRRLQPFIAQAFSHIFGENRHCAIGYKSATYRDEIRFDEAAQMPRDEDVCAAYIANLATSRDKEIDRRQVASGPHRDDWTLYIDGNAARYFASQGQQRALCIALKSPKSCASKTKPKSNPSYCSTIFRANSTRSDIKTSSNSSINSRGKSSSRRRRNHTSTSTASGDYFTFKTESCSVNLNRYHRYHRPLSHCRQRAMISHSKRNLVR